MNDINPINKDRIKETIKKIVSFMNLECQIEIHEELSLENKTALNISVYTPDNARFLIGKNGQNLKALEHLARSILLKDNKDIGILSVDVNDYKKSRASYVIDMAKQAVSKVRNTQKSEILDPMSAHERRVVHMELAAYPDVTTESIGEGPSRRIVIKPYP